MMKKRPVVYQSDRESKALKNKFWTAAILSALIVVFVMSLDVLETPWHLAIFLYLLVYVPFGIVVYAKNILKTRKYN